MAVLSQLKLAMGTRIFLAVFIFAIFLSAIMFILNFSSLLALIARGKYTSDHIYTSI